jgi:hypothetical protein
VFRSRKWVTNGARATLLTAPAQSTVEFKAAARTDSQAVTSVKSNMTQQVKKGPSGTYQLGLVTNLGSARRSPACAYEASLSTFAVFAASALVNSRHV